MKPDYVNVHLKTVFVTYFYKYTYFNEFQKWFTVCIIVNFYIYRVEDMLRWVSGVNNVASVHPVQERPLDLLPEGW